MNFWLRSNRCDVIHRASGSCALAAERWRLQDDPAVAASQR